MSKNGANQSCPPPTCSATEPQPTTSAAASSCSGKLPPWSLASLRAPAREIEHIEPCTVLGSPPIAWAEACLPLDERASGATTVERAGANPGAAGPTGRRNCGWQIVLLASMDGAYGLRQIQGARGQTLHGHESRPRPQVALRSGRLDREEGHARQVGVPVFGREAEEGARARRIGRATRHGVRLGHTRPP